MVFAVKREREGEGKRIAAICTICKATVYFENLKIITIGKALHGQLFVVAKFNGFRLFLIVLVPWNLRQAVWHNQAKSIAPWIHYQFSQLVSFVYSFSFLCESSPNEHLSCLRVSKKSTRRRRRRKTKIQKDSGIKCYLESVPHPRELYRSL